MKIKKGTLCMTLGLLLVVAALSLTAYNLWDERRAAESADAAMAGQPYRGLGKRGGYGVVS